MSVRTGFILITYTYINFLIFTSLRRPIFPGYFCIDHLAAYPTTVIHRIGQKEENDKNAFELYFQKFVKRIVKQFMMLFSPH